jgi:molybdopterin converting factor subunit 1
MRILFFAHLKEVTGCSKVEVELDGRIPADDLWYRLVELYPGLAPHRASVRLARNQVYVGADETFENTDEVALIPPVSGG